MSKIAEFLTCDACGSTLLDCYENGKLEVTISGQEYMEYVCPICHTKNLKYEKFVHERKQDV